ncbi:vWA domain-containing protein [Clostridium intestinale]|uniref:Ca-activated chloride channel family protein n=1 Tax=Clostridium intestinale DSM 6191 TaxID=1121320 RepID=A0A1M5UZZ3_9CLOT|nr:VWA domain-containing protein [Clostridium intestinale]SHH68428.1 Ca-activated chloride channel family protein [Clostridium intestinale DSM 6191]
MKILKNVLTFIIIAGIVFAVVYGGVSLTKNLGKSDTQVSEEDASKTMNKLLKKVSYKEVGARKASVVLESNNLSDTLPSIDKYPVKVENTTDTFVEIFSSSEKAGSGNDAWLLDIANKFNSSSVVVNGKKVSVKIRAISSGEGMDYISSGKYVPDAYTPSNDLWGKMLQAKGIKVDTVEERLLGNVPGVLLSSSKKDELIKKYGSVNLKVITEAVANGELTMGYTNPFQSATGLNFLVSTLNSFDTNLLSDSAVSEFEKFQANIPFVAYTTLQMRESAASGVLDGFIMEYQTYKNSPELFSSYAFTPFGLRHDNPLYGIGNLTDEKKSILNEFVKLCKSGDSQKLAKDYGFNELDNYKSEVSMPAGDTIIRAQKIWKDKKNSGQDIVAVFVADKSGSMEGEPMTKLKESLIKGSQYISNNSSVGLVSYSDDVEINLPIGKFDLNQRSLFTGAVEDINAVGGTATNDGVLVATKMLLEAKEQNPNAKLMLFVLSDGEQNRGLNLDKITPVIEAFKIPIYTIGYNADIDALNVLSSINEAASINADSEDVIYKLSNLFNAQM